MAFALLLFMVTGKTRTGGRYGTVNATQLGRFDRQDASQQQSHNFNFQLQKTNGGVGGDAYGHCFGGSDLARDFRLLKKHQGGCSLAASPTSGDCADNLRHRNRHPWLQ